MGKIIVKLDEDGYYEWLLNVLGFREVICEFSDYYEWNWRNFFKMLLRFLKGIE